jgi:hypothetical protein
MGRHPLQLIDLLDVEQHLHCLAVGSATGRVLRIWKFRHLVPFLRNTHSANAFDRDRAPSRRCENLKCKLYRRDLQATPKVSIPRVVPLSGTTN